MDATDPAVHHLPLGQPADRVEPRAFDTYGTPPDANDPALVLASGGYAFSAPSCSPFMYQRWANAKATSPGVIAIT